VIDRPPVRFEEAECPHGRAQGNSKRLPAVESATRVKRLIEIREVLCRGIAYHAKDGCGQTGSVGDGKDFVAFHVNYVGARLR
jgi:hypothetical protein